VIPAAGQLRRRLRRAQHANRTQTLADALGDAYTLGLFVLLYGGAAVRVLVGRTPLLATVRPPAGAGWLLAGLLVAGAGAAFQGLRALGPLLTTPAAQAWCVGTPVDRRGWLWPRLAALLAAAAVTGAGIGALVARVTRPSGTGWAALAGAGAAAALAALAVVAQGVPDGRRWPSVAGPVAFWAGIALAGVALVVRPAAGSGAPPGVALVAVPLAGFAVGGAWRALPRLDRLRLAAGAGLASAAVTAAMFLDLSLLSAVVEARRWRRTARVRSRGFALRGRVAVLLQAEVRRLARRPGTLGVYALLVLVPYATALFAPVAGALVRIVAGYLAVGRLAPGLRKVSGSPALRRALGGTDSGLRAVHTVVPAAGLAVWWLLALPAAPAYGPVPAVLLPVGILAAGYRAATRPPMSYGGAAVDTPFGLIPFDLIRQLVRGPDVLGLVLLIQLLLSRHG
jgi:hypothetical protein